MKKYLVLLAFVYAASAIAADTGHGSNNQAGHSNDGGKKDATMETKSTADHSGQKMGSSEGNDGKKKSSKQGPRSMQNTIPGTNTTPPPHN
ncbi:hypothetical protein AZI86_13285 [Bdellovibrio bacteriovorus]|uniref:Uncharacterized protein n=1 Tax=Bdellovibrio bacteriovorus TaxID=959 RepID=A0A150WJT5_BDEBC|nr:hypothetical protein [Bdellovibrio bacteriovorus]KYG63791.1 hypothetical protein AZI86_13285 [Bdellovibrio bacteriovorus]